MPYRDFLDQDHVADAKSKETNNVVASSSTAFRTSFASLSMHMTDR